MIGKKDKLMLNSILERPWRKIVIDKVLKEESQDIQGTLITEPYQVKKETDNYFKDLFKRRNHLFEQLSEDWKEEYKAKTWINKEWYSKILEPIQDTEWEEGLKIAKKDTAPGISGISYTMIQKAGPKATTSFINLLNKILRSGIFPRRWKIGQIFPIPKMEEWELSLANTRPIILLEIFRKSLVHIVQKRLSSVLIEHKILRDYNFAGLPGESTGVPIHVIGNILEEAKE